MAARVSGTQANARKQVAPDRFLRLHVLSLLFPHLDGDAFLLGQLLASIESAILETGEDCSDFEQFVAKALRLRQQDPQASGEDFAVISVDFSGRSWEPLFVQAELVRRLKAVAGCPHVLLRIRNLSKALFLGSAYHTRSRADAFAAARRDLTELASRWIARNTHLHLVFD